jgi:glycosyltransferase involved in cell wall biosynthesis
MPPLVRPATPYTAGPTPSVGTEAGKERNSVAWRVGRRTKIRESGFKRKTMNGSTNVVHILIIDGKPEAAEEFARSRYPNCEVSFLSKRKLRELGWSGQLRTLMNLRGPALVVFAESLANIQEAFLLKLTPLVHRCGETVLADQRGTVQLVRRRNLLTLIPAMLYSGLLDGCVILASWIALHLFRWVVPRRFPWNRKSQPALDVAFLYPMPMDRVVAGGALSHVQGVLSGLAEQSAVCEAYSERPLPVTCPVHEIPAVRKLYLFRESLVLSFNLRFYFAAVKELTRRPARVLYQRHGRFVVVGAILARRLGIPLALEYNGSEVWISKHWHPTRFPGLLKLCEHVSLTEASLIVIVSEQMKQQLLDLGIDENKILLNPNAVDPNRFRPGCGGDRLREELGFSPADVVVSFVGTFNYWHGIPILQQATKLLYTSRPVKPDSGKLRFVFVGEGQLLPEMRSALEPYVKDGSVVFTGLLPHDQISRYLDSADIFVSPHVPNLDGTPFFGSPTKLFEYMAMGKAIIASNLDQLSEVLTHGQTGWLVTPGDADELAEAIRYMYANPTLRHKLGAQAREAALSKHTWRQNAHRVLSCFEPQGVGEPPLGPSPVGLGSPLGK